MGSGHGSIIRATQQPDATHAAPHAATLAFPVWATPAVPKSGHATQVVTVLGRGETGLRIRTSGSCVASGASIALIRPGTCKVTVVDRAGRAVRTLRVRVGYAQPGSTSSRMPKAATVTSAAKSLPLCSYPEYPKYKGNGLPTELATSYACAPQ